MMAAVDVYRAKHGEWVALCDIFACPSPIVFGTVSWELAYQAALGHVCMWHPREAA